MFVADPNRWRTLVLFGRGIAVPEVNSADVIAGRRHQLAAVFCLDGQWYGIYDPVEEESDDDPV